MSNRNKNQGSEKVTPQIRQMFDDALALCNSGEHKSAVSIYASILELDPKNATVLYQLGSCAFHGRNFELAQKAFKKAVRYEPRNHIYLCALGVIYFHLNKRQDALQVLGKAIRLKPDYSLSFRTRADGYAIYGDIDSSVSDYSQAIRLSPTDSVSRKNLLYTMCLSASFSEEEIYEAHKLYAQSLETSSITDRFGDGCTNPERKLKIGYLSADFCSHSVAYFIEPIIKNHDQENFEVYCYYNHATSDSTTERIRQLAYQWADIADLSDAQIFDLIQSDQIDILVDLCGYTAFNRIEVLARKPAAIQCEWLGYPATTGLSAVDYWICDEHVNPPGLTEKYYTESLLRLPDCFSCFDPTDDFPEMGSPPCLGNDYITYGSLNTFSKVNPEVIALWAQILTQTPRSRLLLKSKCFADASQRKIVWGFFKDYGISRSRVELLGRHASREEHLKTYMQIDIALDTFPYNGATTTMEALMMGVPVVSMEGNDHRSRVGVTLLKNAGVGELLGGSLNEYREIALALSEDVALISTYRSSLRDKVKRSVLMDASGFTRNLEVAYRTIWRNLCESRSVD